MANNDTIFFSYYYNEDIYHSHFIKIAEEVIDTKFGKINTIKCAPLLEKGRMFKQEYGAFVWVTADEMYIPVKLEIPILVGSIYVTLSCFCGLPQISYVKYQKLFQTSKTFKKKQKEKSKH